jgi:deoxyribodipyrimidine photo-lyase
MVEGLAETAERLNRRGAGFVMHRCDGVVAAKLAALCAEVRPALVVSDENPLCGPDGWRRLLPADFALPFITVDADVIVPSALITKEQFAARTIRPRLTARLPEFLQRVGNRDIAVKNNVTPPTSLNPGALLDGLPLDRSVQPSSEFKGGTEHALKRLRTFINEQLPTYPDARSHPETEGTSRLSPYLHFGQIGPHTVALAVQDAEAPERARQIFLEELIVRRELAINFVRFNRRFRSLRSAEAWALATLRNHADDLRPYRYSERRLEEAQTHDELWNAAQRQMTTIGWMHNHMRMYWAKKILEWSKSPAEAYRIAVRLNDRYELDGRDANSYAGVAWAIGGKHDRAWGPERPIYGKIRYMSAASTGRKFNSRAYIERWRRD